MAAASAIVVRFAFGRSGTGDAGARFPAFGEHHGAPATRCLTDVASD
jgi:hypothetical protein